jgi:phospholipase D-like protein
VNDGFLARTLKMRWRRLLLLCLVALWAGAAWHETHKPLPVGTHLASPTCTVAAQDVAFVADITAADAWGHPVSSQAIFDNVLEVMHAARRFIVLDYAAFGAGAAADPARRVAAELTDALLARRRAQPGLAVLFITDPASERYGAARSPELQLLRAAGIDVVITAVDQLRDPNLLYAGLWRPDLRGGARRVGFKANDRKLIIADDGHDGLATMVGSANPFDAESGFSNLALRARQGALPALLASELAIARFSGWHGRNDAFSAAADCLPAPRDLAPELSAQLQVLTEGAIRAELLGRLDGTDGGDTIDVAAFRLADRDIVKALLGASRRGVGVRLILDPNETAVTGGTAGLPNQPVATELVSRSGGAIRVRWYRTHGERFHGTLVLVRARQHAWLTLGSAQLTRRSLDDYNLEANLAVEVPRNAALAQQALGYFETLWGNRAALGIEYSADFTAFADTEQSDYWVYRLLEGTGLSAF